MISVMSSSCSGVLEIVAEKGIKQRDDYCIEYYVNNPRITPEEKLITEILIPTA
jgi:DNA gyrase inhibitor GyrI